MAKKIFCLEWFGRLPSNNITQTLVESKMPILGHQTKVEGISQTAELHCKGEVQAEEASGFKQSGDEETR